MKRTITITEDDGSGKSGGGGKAQGMNQVAAQGQHGDTRLAHVNPFEEALLKAIGGAGTKNPNTGLKQFYTLADTKTGLDEWYKNAYGRTPSADEVQYWYGKAGNTGLTQGLWDEFRNAGTTETYSGWMPTGYTNTAATTGGDFFNFPLDIYPSSESNSTSTSGSNALNYGTSGSQNTSNNSSLNTSDTGSLNTGVSSSVNNSLNNSENSSYNYSGLPAEYRDALLAAIIPQLITSANDASANYDEYTNQALGSYQQTLQNALRENVPAILAKLANRGIINSSEGSGALGTVMGNAAIDASTKGYNTAMQAALAKATNIPDLLAKIAGLGQYSTGTSEGTSTGTSTGSSLGNTYGTSYGTSLGTSAGTSQGTSASSNFGLSDSASNSISSSLTKDPTVMYELMKQVILDMT